MLVRDGAALSTRSIPTRKRHSRRKRARLAVLRLVAKMPTLAAFAYRHVKGMPYVYPDNYASVRGKLPVHDVHDDRAEVRGASGVRAGDRHSLHSSCRSRAELLDQRRAGGWFLARRSVLGGRGGNRGALRPAPRRRERSGAAHARSNRLERTFRRSSPR